MLFVAKWEDSTDKKCEVHALTEDGFGIKDYHCETVDLQDVINLCARYRKIRGDVRNLYFVRERDSKIEVVMLEETARGTVSEMVLHSDVQDLEKAQTLCTLWRESN